MEIGRKSLSLESAALAYASENLDESFSKAVNTIQNSQGRVIVSGIGKSANVAQKIVATFNSTGTPSIFMHAADAIHGDLGNIQKNDVVLLLSKSGNTAEIKVLIPLIRDLGNKIISICGNLDSYLGNAADINIDSTIEQEACPHNLAPTTSTTLQMALGDALAIALLESRGFSETDFAKNHPGGILGKTLYLRLKDVYPLNEKPELSAGSAIRDVIIEVSSKRLGLAVVVENEKVTGVITDGDIRRMLENNTNIQDLTAGDIMTPNPQTLDESEFAINAMRLMNSKSINQVIVTSEGKYCGVVHLHDLIREGLI